MTPKNPSDSAEDDSRGILDEAASLDTTAIGIHGQTAQVSVTLPRDEDDDLVDDAVVDGEVLSELIVDSPLEVAAVTAASVGRIDDERIGIVIELPADESAEVPADEISERVVEPEPEHATPDEVIVESFIEADAAHAVAVPRSDAKSEPVAKPESDAKPESPVIKPKAKKKPHTESRKPAPEPEPKPEPEAAPAAAEAESAPDEPTQPESKPMVSATAEPLPRAATATSAWIAAAMKQDAAASAKPAPSPAASAPAEKAKSETVNPEEDPKPAEKAVAQRPAVSRPEVALTSRRLGDQLGQSTRESADLLTADRLLDPHQVTKPEPEGAWSHFLYAASGRRINLGDGKRARARKELTARIAAPLTGGARFVPVMSRKGGVGKTTITALLGMALADARDDRVIAVDANPDRGTLADRIVRTHGKSVRDLVRVHDEVKGYHDISAIVARDSTRLDVLASDSDPRIAEAFSDDDYRDVANVAAHYYSLVLTDTGTGIVHSVMGATLDLADQLIIVSGLSVDEARLASETLTWLETNGYAELARRSIVVLNQSAHGSPLVRLNELEAHFATRAKSVVRMPYDAQIAGGGTIVFANLQPETRQAARELAASLIEGLRASAS